MRWHKLPDSIFTENLKLEEIHSVSTIFKTSAKVASGFQTRETFEITRPRAGRVFFYCFDRERLET